MKGTIKLPFNVKRASEDFIKAFIQLGYLYVDETGIHVCESEEHRR